VGDQPAGTDSAGGALSVETADGVVTLKAKPVRIISLAPTHTESLFAIGAGAQVVAVDDQSNFPADATKVKSNLSGFTPNIEAIAGYEPDLVVMSADTEDHVVAQLGSLGIPVWIGPAASTLEDVYSEIQQLGVLTDHSAQASSLISKMKADVQSILADVPETEVPLTYYHELDNTYYSVTSHSFIGQLYSLANLRNIADDASAGNDYPQLNAEYIITSDPDLIFLADTKCCGESGKTVAARDGWSGITAVENGHVIEMDDDISSRWGPRVVDYLRAIVDAVKAAASVGVGS
jgi:iron complex transport system substrate-binding protein